MTKKIVVTGPFDDIRSRDLRFLQEASRLGEVTVLIWSDSKIQSVLGRVPKFPLAERRYFLKAVRYVSHVLPLEGTFPEERLQLPIGFCPDLWADCSGFANHERSIAARKLGIEYLVLPDRALNGFPQLPGEGLFSDRKKVVVTGCYDWLHSGHVRFFEEVNTYGDLLVIVGHNQNIRLLKGEGHPLLPEEERRYLVGSIRYVSQALVSSGQGWLDADPEIQRWKPNIYAVNEDGDKGGKREYCERNGIDYLVLRRIPAPGLPARSSTDLRGF